MALSYSSLIILILGYACAAPANDLEKNKASPLTQNLDQEKDDLKTAASNSHSRRSYSNWGGGYPASYGYGVTGYGTIDDRYSSYYSGGGGIGAYDSNYGYSGSYPGYGGFAGSAGYGGYSNRGSGGGYGLTGYSGYGGGYGGYGGGYGGYGGWGGNGGLNSYYGYNNPNYDGNYHLGYGYYNKRGYGNIYQNGVTPSLVTGYRGYSRR